MRVHYKSLNYADGQPGACNFRFSRTAGESSGLFFEDGKDDEQLVLTHSEIQALRDMLNEVLEDWK